MKILVGGILLLVKTALGGDSQYMILLALYLEFPNMDAHAFSTSALIGQKLNVRKNVRAEIKFGFLKKAKIPQII